MSKEMRMKEYVKPSLQGLGLLRLITRFSTDPPVSVGSGDTGNGSNTGTPGTHWHLHGHAAPGELI